MRDAVAGQTRLKIVNKPLNDLILHFSIYRAKERTQATLDSFPSFLRLKIGFDLVMLDITDLILSRLESTPWMLPALKNYCWSSSEPSSWLTTSGRLT
uniref:Uncharacterized protein n=1 Tax=Solanum tuberosum TaxID=4113 RepID=M1DMB5_SOLTU